MAELPTIPLLPEPAAKENAACSARFLRTARGGTVRRASGSPRGAMDQGEENDTVALTPGVAELFATVILWGG